MTQTRTDTVHQALTEWQTWLRNEQLSNARKMWEIQRQMRATGQLIWSDALGRYVTIPEDDE